MISDSHLLINKPKARLDDAVTTGFKKMEFILEWCLKNGASLLIAGDLTERPRSWHLLPKLLNLFSNYSSDEMITVHAIFGQHDVYMYSEETKSNTMLGALQSSNIINILNDFPYSLGNGVNLYGCSYGQEIPKVENKKDKNILVIHAPIAEDKLKMPGVISAKDFLKDNKDYDIILCGDIHREFFLYDKNNRTILNTGPMIRKTADEYNFTFKPNFMVYDTIKDKFERVEIPHKPAEEVLSREHIEDSEKKEELRSRFTDSLNKEVELDVSFNANFEIFMKEKKVRENVRNIIVGEISELEETK